MQASIKAHLHLDILKPQDLSMVKDKQIQFPGAQLVRVYSEEHAPGACIHPFRVMKISCWDQNDTAVVVEILNPNGTTEDFVYHTGGSRNDADKLVRGLTDRVNEAKQDWYDSWGAWAGDTPLLQEFGPEPKQPLTRMQRLGFLLGITAVVLVVTAEVVQALSTLGLV